MKTFYTVTFATANGSHVFGSVNETERKAINSFKRFCSMAGVVAVKVYQGQAGGLLLQEWAAV